MVKHYRAVRVAPDSWVLKDEEDNLVPNAQERFYYDSQARAEQQAEKFNEIGTNNPETDLS